MLKKFWPVIALLIVGIACYASKASPAVAITSLVGITYVVLVAYGHWTANVFGAILGALFGWMSYEAGFFGNALINLTFTVPASLWGIWYWRKHQGEKPRKLTDKQLIAGVTVFTVASIISLGMARYHGSSLWYLDGMSAVIPIFATLLLVNRFKEQWCLWIPYNMMEVIMWSWMASIAPETLAILVMRIVFLFNSMYGYYLWHKS